MHARDPNRPKMGNGQPMYMDHRLKGIAALPTIQVSVSTLSTYDHFHWVATVGLMVEYNEAKYYDRTFDTDGLHDFLHRYQVDPEQCFMDFFNYYGYENKPKRQREVRAVPTLDDLGL